MNSVDGPDHREGHGKSPQRTSPGDTASGARVVHPLVRLYIPETWPEAIAHAAGRRLFREETDELPTLIRGGLPIDRHLRPQELGAMLDLGWATFERWLLQGWKAEENREG